MPLYRDRPLVPRNGHTLVVGIIARISGCQNQKELSLEDQVDHAKQVVADLYQGPVDYRIISTKGKGERLDRPELADVERLLRTREVDILVAEDIGRVVRGAAAVPLCGIAVDHGTRVLAPNDCIDTAEDTWEEDVISACRDHVGHNAHTSKCLKHKLMNRFLKLGGATPVAIFGYVKPPGARTYEDWRKDPEATPIYQGWFRRLGESLNCSAVADWLNQLGAPPGAYSRRERWNGQMVRRLTRNPLLKGMPGRGFKHTVKHHETGRRVAVKNPKGPQFREYPALAHVDAAVQDEVNARLDARNGRYRRRPVGGEDPLARVPRKRTRFPGQYARCWYGGRHCVWGGNGLTENLMCSGAHEWTCWNAVGFSGGLVARRLVEAVTVELYALDGFDDQFRDIVREASLAGGSDLARRWEQLRRGEEALAQHKQHLLEAITEYGPKQMFQEKLSELEGTERGLASDRRALQALATRARELPASAAQLRELLEEGFRKFARDSPEFGEFMRPLVPRLARSAHVG